jgi:hypothetical protein
MGLLFQNGEKFIKIEHKEYNNGLSRHFELLEKKIKVQGIDLRFKKDQEYVIYSAYLNVQNVITSLFELMSP